ncbi:hypothetical protein ccbrp13_30710 [Ktedonobacteria bacterium brp13]|nr:hypothetical protein ccbrp13_30710 [Ktedonobacteria bacterium brp13]
MKQEITVHEQGITAEYYGKATTIPWHEVQGFDIWGGKTKRMISYELIGENGVVRWVVPNQYRLFFPFKPTIPNDEYTQKMAALQQVIVAQSGKPLYSSLYRCLFLYQLCRLCWQEFANQ